jgi:3-deoxy-D-manno-octulosonate cytidylyltransferase
VTGRCAVAAVIPARYASTRFPGKLLEPLHGRPLLQYVYERARRIAGLDRLLVATDDERIARAAEAFGAEVRMTAAGHASGTDRVAEAVESLDAPPDLVLNLQGDEPLLPIVGVERLLAGLRAMPDAIWTLAHPIQRLEDLASPSVVKVVRAADGRALYFSRAPVPFARGPEQEGRLALRHVGVYGYPLDLLRRLVALPPSGLERIEGLEQLRALEAGIPIRVVECAGESPGVDVPEDLERLRMRYPTAEAMERAEEPEAPRAPAPAPGQRADGTGAGGRRTGEPGGP